METIQQECLELFRRKNHDYGDSFADYSVIGVLVRMGDKLKRYVSVSNNGVSLVNDEALRDTLKDLHNYSAMAIMLLDEEKEQKQLELSLSLVGAKLNTEEERPMTVLS